MYPDYNDDVAHLGDVNLGALGAGHDHGLEVVELRQRLLSAAARLVSGVIQQSVDDVLECLPERVTGRRLQFVVVGFLYHLNHVFL